MEKNILQHLIFNEEYARKALPFLKDIYFADITDKSIFNLVEKYFTEYNATPTKNALLVELENLNNISD